jgi:membrane protein required for colicin V production
MATLDLIIWGLITVSAVIGMVRGFVKEATSLGAWIGAVAAAMFFGPILASTFPDSWAESPLGLNIAYGMMFTIAVVVGLNLQLLLTRLVSSSGLTGTDCFLGIIFGGFRGAVVVTVLLMGLQTFVSGASWWEESDLKDTYLDFEDEVWGSLDFANEVMTELRAEGDDADVPDLPDLPDDADIDYEDYEDYDY